MLKRFLQLRRDQRGTAIIELALAAPVLAILTIGVTDISIAYGKKLQLEQAAQRAIEKVAQTTGENTVTDTIKSEAVCQYNGMNGSSCKTAPITSDNVSVTFKLTCNGVDTTWTLDCAGGETEVRYITTTVTDTYTPIFPLHFGTNADGTYHLSATAGVRVV
jgi:Flp pilus assembly protein TadG